MVRDFTNATKERLSNEIDDINKKEWCPVTDAIGDALRWLGKWGGIIALNEDMSNVRSYQRHVLDMTDMTKKELHKIFEKVYALDTEYQGFFSKLNKCEREYQGKIKGMCSCIQPGFSICDAETIRNTLKPYNAKLKAINAKIDKDFEKEVGWAAERAALKAVPNMVASCAKLVINVCTMPARLCKNLVTNRSAIFTDTWSLIDDVFAVGSTSAGLATLIIGTGIAAITNNKEIKNKAVTISEELSGAKGLTDYLEAEQKTFGKNNPSLSTVKRLSKGVDTASNAVGLYSDVKSFLKDPSKMVDGKLGFETKLELKEEGMIEKYKDYYPQLQERYERLVKMNHNLELENMKTFYQYVTGEGNIVTNFNKWLKSGRDAYDLGEDIAESLGLSQ